MTMKTAAPAALRCAARIGLPLLAAGLLGACGILSGTVDDKGRAYQQTIDAPVESNLEPLAAQPSIQILNDRIPTRGGGDTSRTGGEPPSACEAEMWMGLIGLDEDQVLAEKNLPAQMRIIHWGDMVTQDYIPSRLNIRLDQNGDVYRVTCG